MVEEADNQLKPIDVIQQFTTETSSDPVSPKDSAAQSDKQRRQELDAELSDLIAKAEASMESSDEKAAISYLKQALVSQSLQFLRGFLKFYEFECLPTSLLLDQSIDQSNEQAQSLMQQVLEPLQAKSKKEVELAKTEIL